MGVGEILIIVGASVIAFSSVISVGVMNGKLEDVETIQEKFLVNILIHLTHNGLGVIV